MKEPVKILFISQEITPYLPESEIATICREYPQYVQEKGCEIRTFMPCFGCINERRNQLHEVQRLSGMNLIIDDTDHPLIIKVASIQSARMQVYFIDNDDYFHRKGTICDAEGTEYKDNDDRLIFFARGVLETIKKLRWTPDIIHCQGWLTALAPLYIKKVYNADPFFRDAKVIYSVYNDGFKKKLRTGFHNHLMVKGIEQDDLTSINNVKTVDFESLSKLAIDFSDGIIMADANTNKTLAQYIANKGIPYLPYSENYKENYLNFYSSIYPPIAE
ncbi:MAG: glycogen/starch synthase [Paludibacteraceae bacterium]|jgi:starch synthase|nr:glycogen/starch synthase [Paludibacteraceae bacterium]